MASPRHASDESSVRSKATDLTIGHYSRPEVKATILRYCQDTHAFRALNGDESWYKSTENGKIRLTIPDDYDYLSKKFRTFYATLDLLDPAVKSISERWDENKGKPENPIGTLKDCLAFTLSVDIDSIKGPNGENITNSPEIKKAVEDAGQFFVNYLREHGIKKSVYCLYSGGGIYVHVHHELFRAKTEWTPEDREQAARSLTVAYNALIADISKNFFEQYPEHEGRVKFDQLNNQKRKFKVIFSIHKRLPFAVIPLDPEHIEIDFDKAKLPLSSEVLAEGTTWYQGYDIGELPRLKELLQLYIEQAEEELRERKARTGNYEISRLLEALPQEIWSPCMKNVQAKVAPGKGPHRALAILASYLYQAGWPEDKAFELWEPLADKSGVEPRIFDCWYGLMSCPSCDKIKKESGGYPRIGLGGLGYCEPEKCEGCKWPGDYGKKGLLPKEWSEGYFVNLNGETFKGSLSKNEDGEEKQKKWISDGYAFIDTILETYDKDIERHFVITGKGKSAKDQFRFTIKASDASESRKLKACLVNAFGVDPIGQLDLYAIQKLSNHPAYIRVFNRPLWLDDKLIAPGLVDNAEFNFERKVCIDFQDVGSVSKGLKALENICKGWDVRNTTSLIATHFGAPVIARLWPDERFALFLIGLTGTFKTTVAMLLQSIYGQRYNFEANLVRWGDGATSNATEYLAAKTGPFPFIIDNFKLYSDQDAGRLQRLIHAICEGTEKDRLNRESSLRQSEDYLCTPIITGENYPGQDAATRARIVQIEWSDPSDLDAITEAQRHTKDLNALGKAWVEWLGSDEGKKAMDEIASKFDATRTQYLQDTKGSVNAGRIATNAAILSLIWYLLSKWPVTSGFAEEYAKSIKASIDTHISQAKEDILGHLDGEKFVSWLRAEIEVGHYLIEDTPKEVKSLDPYAKPIGKYRIDETKLKKEEELLITQAVLASVLLPAWQKSTTGVKADKTALFRQLSKLGYLQYNEAEKRYTSVRKFEGRNQRVHIFDYLKIFDDGLPGLPVENPTGSGKTDNVEPCATGATVATGQKGEKFLENFLETIEKRQKLPDPTGSHGSHGSRKSIGIDYTATKHSKSATVATNNPPFSCDDTQMIGPNPRKDEPTPTQNTELRCLACGYPTGSGHGSYYNTLFCSTCGPKLVMVKAAIKAHPEFSLSELWEDLAARGRPPTQEHFLAMIHYLKEAESNWAGQIHETINQSIDEVQ